ncbi:unnamed protein product [Medioppia subpectinata]|uniref:Uncharacterized protein n=2 Tax=Medioppia subpectinata TaxID=1979941 RepID=A0A7R9PZ09_9ACAR|nr:unnamed protein product [Medioppia subpectinata]CAG2105972.1 unnamed protein product [Medioppia subpectinata]
MGSRSRGTKPKSIVWKYYESAEDTDGRDVLKCRFCGTRFTASVAKNATKLRHHLIRKCPDIAQDVKDSLDVMDDPDYDNTRNKYKQVKAEDTDPTDGKKKALTGHIVTKIVVKSAKSSAYKSRAEEDADLLDGTDLMDRRELKTRVRSLEEENSRLTTRLRLCLKQNEALIQVTKHLEQSLKLMDRLETINKIHSIRFDDNEEEVDGLTDELNASNESANQWKQKLKTIEMQFIDTEEREEKEDNYQKNIDRMVNPKSQRPQSSIWKYYKLEEKDESDGLRVIHCIFCDKTFRHKNLNAFKSRTHIVENCDKCPQEIKDKENIWTEPQPKSKVDIWSHFHLNTDNDKTCTECLYCGHKYHYKNATKCRQHLVFKCEQIPFEVKETIRNQCDQSFLNNTKSTEPIKTRLSNIWNHYDNCNDSEGKETYKCQYCGQLYATRNATKFRQHLVDRCERIPENIRQELTLETMESSRTWTQAKVPVWSHYKLWQEFGKQMCRCVYCGTTYGYKNATKCRIHLMLKCDKIPVEMKLKIRKESHDLYMSALNAKNELKFHKREKTRKLIIKSARIPRKPKSRIWDHFKDDKDIKGDICCWPGCEMKFPKRSRLLNHQKVHTGDIVRVPCDWPGCEKPYHCDWPGCEFKTAKPSSLCVHKPYHCDWPGCEFKTAKPSSLCVHKMRHKNVLRYKCDWPECERTFLTSSQRTVHKMVHMGIKPHACQYCDKRYPQLNKLKTHQNKHHFNQLPNTSYD